MSAVDDAANLESHFEDRSFNLVATHFITGFVPMGLLAPKVAARLERGGLWSLVGGTKAGFPVLQKKANKLLFKLLFHVKSLDLTEFVCNPAGEQEVIDTFHRNGFIVRACQTFEPELAFKNFDQFLEFAYYGGWLTPFVESFGLHRARPALRAILNGVFFPVEDHHHVVIALGQKE